MEENQKIKINQSFRYLDNTYEKIINREFNLHKDTLAAIEEIKNETEFENIYGEMIVRSDEEKQIEIKELETRFLISEDRYNELEELLRLKPWKKNKNQIEVYLLDDLAMEECIVNTDYDYDEYN